MEEFVLFSPFICYCGFIFYMFISIISIIVFFFIYTIKIYRVDARPHEHIQDFDRYNKEIDEIDKELGNAKLSEGITISSSNS